MTKHIHSFLLLNEVFPKIFFLSVIKKWNKLDLNTYGCISDTSFSKALLLFIRPIKENHAQVSIRLLTKMRLRLNHLHECEWSIYVEMQHLGCNYFSSMLPAQYGKFSWINKSTLTDPSCQLGHCSISFSYFWFIKINLW